MPFLLSQWRRFVQFLHQPEDPSLLAYLRILFGILMMIDIPQERGMSHAYEFFSRTDLCHFPLLNDLHIFGPDGMVICYAVLFLSAFCISIGLFYRTSCFLFTSFYWYIYILDKSSWNNHSTLYGILSFLLLFTDAHRYLSLDSYLQPNIHNTKVPRWNYVLFRFQIFVVYFYAALKKTDFDWLSGHSMGMLGKHWVFSPFKVLFSDEFISLYVVHLGGFLLDLLAGFILYFDQTRVFGFIFCGSFHLMNSQLFSIGMFPYMMLVTMPIFCKSTTIKDLFKKSKTLSAFVDVKEAKTNLTCIKKSTCWRQYLSTCFVIVFVSEQLFLPYSHFITKGNNGWTNGLYGYSWDMMIHSFSTQHVKIQYKDVENNQTGFIKPNSFIAGRRNRWNSHPDMIVQYAKCIRKRLESHGIRNAEIYMDIWKSVNGRYYQRFVNPEIDLANCEWNVFEKPQFLMPLLEELSSWRSTFKKIKEKHKNSNESKHFTFVSDFPGFKLNNFLHQDLSNTKLKVLRGRIHVNENTNVSYVLTKNKSLILSNNGFHTIETVSKTPSCFAYIYWNATSKMTPRNDTKFFLETTKSFSTSPERHFVKNHSLKSSTSNFGKFMLKKYILFRNSFYSVLFASKNIWNEITKELTRIYKAQMNVQCSRSICSVKNEL